MKNQKALISVIVPVYNVEPYLEDCIDSILNQIYRRLEVILVDDGSTDGCGLICDKYATVDARVKVIHKQNGGLADARNAGVQTATGDFVGFVDSDDIVDAHMYAVLLNDILENQADIAMCTYSTFDKVPFYENEFDDSVQIFTKTEFLDAYVNGHNRYKITPSVWTRLYKRELIKELSFPKGRCFEDVVWTVQVADRARQIVYRDAPLYYYRQRSSSITNSNNKHGINESMLVDRTHEHRRLYEILFELNYQKLSDEARYQYIRMIMEYYCKIRIYRIEEFYRFLPFLKSDIISHRPWIKKINEGSVDKRKKRILWLISVSPDMYVWVWLGMEVLKIFTEERKTC